MEPLELPSTADVQRAAARQSEMLAPTPLLRLGRADENALAIKAECLQPTGSFKVRGAGNLLCDLRGSNLPRLVYTASAGNMALAVAWHADRLGIRAAAIVPETAPEAKTARIAELGADVVTVPFDAWWQAMLDGSYPAFDGTFVHPFCDPSVIAGNAVIGLEIAKQEPDVDAVVVPFGGGGLVLGVYSGLRAAGSEAPVFAAEVDTAAPLALGLAAGKPVEPDRVPSFVDGIGGRAVFPEIWPHVESKLAGSIVVSIAETAQALRLVARETKLMVEGAGAAAVAAAMRLRGTYGHIVAVGSGGNIDHDVVARILAGADA